MYDPERWMRFLSTSMAEAGVNGPADLCRRAGLRQQSIFTKWQHGSQPGNDVLRKLAPVLGVPVRTLLVEAGHFDEDELAGGDDALATILASKVLTDKQKLRLINEWVRSNREREHRFVTLVEQLLSRSDEMPDQREVLP